MQSDQGGCPGGAKSKVFSKRSDRQQEKGTTKKINQKEDEFNEKGENRLLKKGRWSVGKALRRGDWWWNRLRNSARCPGPEEVEQEKVKGKTGDGEELGRYCSPQIKLGPGKKNAANSNI